jgi:transcriptional regulator with XRE-family HTH domain
MPEEGRLTLRRLREAAGLTRARLAVQLGTSESVVFNWERGQTEPTLSHLRGLARIFGTTIDEIVRAYDAGKLG